MTDANTLTPCPHLESCPWCGCALYAVWRRANPRASCKTEGCFGRKMAVVNLDDPRDVAAWNCRSPSPASQPAAPIAPAREPLTDEQIDEIHLANSDAYERGDVEYESHGFARAIEHHHGITAAQKGGQHEF